MSGIRQNTQKDLAPKKNTDIVEPWPAEPILLQNSLDVIRLP